MSLGSIPLQKRFSEDQFVGDLMSLFARHRIDCGDHGSAAQFESLLASKDAFRSQLFTLCTAISHMSDADLSGEQLLGLIGRALGGPEASVDGGAGGLPDSLRAAFLGGYEAWSNRDLYGSELWPRSREPAPSNSPIPFPRPARGFSEPDLPDVRVPGTSGAGTLAAGARTVQEALLMARKQTPFELAPRTPELLPRTPEVPAGAQSAAGANVEGLSLGELTKLLEDIERRMNRIEPQVHELAALAPPAAETFDRIKKAHETAVALSSAVVVPSARAGPSLVAAPAAPLPLPTDGAESSATESGDDPFLSRHAYLKPTPRRVLAAVPAPLIVVPRPPPPKPNAEPVAVRVTLEGDSVKDEVVESPTRLVLIPSAETTRTQMKVNLAIAVLAAIILVGVPWAGLMVYRSTHTRYFYRDQDFKPATPPIVDMEVPASKASPGQAAAANLPNRKLSPAVAPASRSKTSYAAQNHRLAKGLANRPTQPVPPVAIWPPPPK